MLYLHLCLFKRSFSLLFFSSLRGQFYLNKALPIITAFQIRKHSSNNQATAVMISATEEFKLHSLVAPKSSLPTITMKKNQLRLTAEQFKCRATCIAYPAAPLIRAQGDRALPDIRMPLWNSSPETKVEIHRFIQVWISQKACRHVWTQEEKVLANLFWNFRYRAFLMKTVSLKRLKI